ncbi:hypothetical protein LIER_07742 [Lithospermum erythrorhizon]|uniref:AT-hook motif nuclear-localized protein n=1 Tax=Lithospermum erythrorhizon TaxID=34254 RepID=A0AAV3PBD2_LITER
MDGREGMSISGAASYYLNNRGGVGGSMGPADGWSGSGAPPMFGTPPSYNPNGSFQSANAIGTSGDAMSSSFQMEHTSQGFPQGAVASPPGDSVKKKRGRPRKYAPDGTNMSLGLSLISTKPSGDLTSSGPKRSRGRPPGSGWKQQLAPLGEWMNSSAGLAFTPHVICVAVGEDVAAKILYFAQQRPRALCILSASGSVSAITFRAASGGTVTYEGRFEMLCLSGSYLLDEDGGPRDRTGGISISVCSPDGHVIGGAIGGRLTAATLVQVIACSFVYGGNTKSKVEASAKGEDGTTEQVEKSPTPNTTVSGNDHTRDSAGVWPAGVQPNSRSSQTEIDLTRG